MIKFDFPSGKAGVPLVLGLGVFDGVHRGHRKIISELVDMGRRYDAMPVAVTFFPHPREVLGQLPLPRLLLSPEERLRRLRRAGAQGIGIIEFSASLADTPAEAFLERLLSDIPDLRGICVGSRWRFGRGGFGDTGYLAAELARRGIAFNPVPEVSFEGLIVSSSLIRNTITAGELDLAMAMLGDYPTLCGEVVHGAGLAGALLNTPTANMYPEFGILPPNGVYATLTTIDGRVYPSVTNIGNAPTFERGGERWTETHLLNFSGELYQRKMTVALVVKLRAEKKFRSAADLKKQIGADIAKAEKILTSGAV